MDIKKVVNEKSFFLNNLLNKAEGSSISFIATLSSWRDLGGIMFLSVIYDKNIIQVILNDSILFKKKELLQTGVLLFIKGDLKKRKPENINILSPTGKIEVIAEECKIILPHTAQLSDLLPVNEKIPTIKNSIFLKYIREKITRYGYLEYPYTLITKKFMYPESLKLEHSFSNINEDYQLFYRIDNLKNGEITLYGGGKYTSFSMPKNTIEDMLYKALLLSFNIKIKPFLTIKKSSFKLAKESKDIRFLDISFDVSYLFKKMDSTIFQDKLTWMYALPLSKISKDCLEKLKNYFSNKPNIFFTWGECSKNFVIKGPLSTILSEENKDKLLKQYKIKKNDLILLFTSSNDKNLTAFKKYLSDLLLQLFFPKKIDRIKLWWIDKKTNTKTSLICNGKKIGWYKLTPYSVLHESLNNKQKDYSPYSGEFFINLSSLLEEITNPKDFSIENNLNNLPIRSLSTKKEKYSIKKFEENTIEKTMSCIAVEENEETANLFVLSPTKTFSRNLYEVLENFNMVKEEAEFILNLLPDKKTYLENSSKEQIFRLLWSVLGHFHVQEIIKSIEGREILLLLVKEKILTDIRQLLYLQLSSLLQIKRIIINHCYEEDDNNRIVSIHKFLAIIKSFLSSNPNHFSNIIYFLSRNITKKNPGHILLRDKFLKNKLIIACHEGLSSTIFLESFLKNHINIQYINHLLQSIKILDYLVFPNSKINPEEIMITLTSSITLCHFKKNIFSFLSEVIYFLFQPVNMDIYSIYSYICLLKDCSHHFQDAGIKFVGDNWNPYLKGYYFYEESTTLSSIVIYPSKNIASFFAKASSGICTAIDIELFMRSDHFHLNIVDNYKKKVIGNTQFYLIKEKNKKIIFLRGINPSSSVVNCQNASFFINSIFSTAIQLAKGSNLDAVYICPSLGIWHVESSRLEIIAALRILYKDLEIKKLQEPLFLFEFNGQRKTIQSAYSIWEKGKD